MLWIEAYKAHTTTQRARVRFKFDRLSAEVDQLYADVLEDLCRTVTLKEYPQTLHDRISYTMNKLGDAHTKVSNEVDLIKKLYTLIAEAARECAHVDDFISA